MGTLASQIASLTIVFSTVYSDTDQRKRQSSASLAFVRGIPRTNGQWRGKCFRLMTSSWLGQVIAWSLTPRSHYLNKCWLIIKRNLWHWSRNYLTRIADVVSTKHAFTHMKYIFCNMYIAESHLTLSQDLSEISEKLWNVFEPIACFHYYEIATQMHLVKSALLKYFSGTHKVVWYDTFCMVSVGWYNVGIDYGVYGDIAITAGNLSCDTAGIRFKDQPHQYYTVSRNPFGDVLLRHSKLIGYRWSATSCVCRGCRPGIYLRECFINFVIVIWLHIAYSIVPKSDQDFLIAFI